MSNSDPFDDDLIEDDDSSATNMLMTRVRQALTRWWILLLCAIVGYFAALYLQTIKPPSNEATAKLKVDLKFKQLIGAELEQERNQVETLLATVATEITGPDLLSEVVNHPDVQALDRAVPPDFSLKPLQFRTEEERAFKAASEVSNVELAKMLRDSLKVSIIPGTTLIEAKVQHQDPETARVIADTLLNVFMERRENERVGGVTEAFKALQSEAEQARRNFESAQRSLQVYVSALKLNEDLKVKRDELLTLRQRYRAKHPAMIEIEATYSDLYERFRREISRAIETPSEKDFWLDYRQDLADLETQAAVAGPEGAQARDEWIALAQNALGTRSNLLQSRIASQESLYTSVTKRMTEIEVAEDNNDAGFVISEPAFISSKLATKRLSTLGVGSLVGLVVGFGIAYFIGLIDFKIYDVRSAEEITGLAALAALPISPELGRPEGRSKPWKSILLREPSSPNSESIRNLRTSLILLGKKERHQTFLITSALPAEGKTSVAVELAAAFALNKERTLLIDLDMRRPRIGRMIPEASDKSGIVEVLAGQKKLSEAICATEIENLSVIPSGEKATNPSELLHEAELIEILSVVKQQFDRIIIDGAPILPVSDSRVIARLVDDVALVIRSHNTPVGATMRARDLLEEGGAHIAGVIVNGMKKSVRSSYYYYGYKGYGEYGATKYAYHDEAD